jgi:hypothetical protein
MTTATNSLELILVALVMLVAGIRQKRLEWKPRDGSWLRKLKPPRTGRRTGI